MLPGLKKKAHKDAMRIAIELLCRLDDWRTRQDGVTYWNRPIVGTEAERGARQLEPFSVDTWPDWFELAWDILLQEHAAIQRTILSCGAWVNIARIIPNSRERRRERRLERRRAMFRME